MGAKTKFGVITITLLSLIIFSGCTTQSQSSLEISSADSVSIENTEAPSVERVISLANGSAEIISALGLKKIIVGRDVASTEEDLKQIPVVTSGHQVIAEKIISLNPDLVIIDKSTGPQNAIAAIRTAGIRVVETPEAWTLAEIEPKITAIAAAIGVTKDGAILNAKMFSKLSPSSDPNSGVRAAFLYLRSSSAIYLIGGKGSGADSLLGAIGAVDVGAQKLDLPFTAMTSEAIAALNPEVIFVMTKGLASTGGVDGLVALPGVAQTDAGKNRRIIAVDDSLMLSFGPRTPNLILQMSNALAKVMKS
ncbi:hypothetical protein GM51_19205 [freshwater metagenome]|uniref:Fe/B12 periplasmic-binding domain-containing protein n=1 Tax=freshwater metagenome TaxID=449393 RepID=A0A094PRC1_9ZZZZ